MHAMARAAAASLLFTLAACIAPAAQPVDTTPPPPAAFTLALGERHHVDGVAVTPLSIIEDSRCPTGVQCVWAGTVRLQVAVERDGRSSPIEVRLAGPTEIGGAWLHLLAACPYPARPDTAIAQPDYRFTLLISQDRADAPVPSSTCA